MYQRFLLPNPPPPPPPSSLPGTSCDIETKTGSVTGAPWSSFKHQNQKQGTRNFTSPPKLTCDPFSWLCFNSNESILDGELSLVQPKQGTSELKTTSVFVAVLVELVIVICLMELRRIHKGLELRTIGGRPPYPFGPIFINTIFCLIWNKKLSHSKISLFLPLPKLKYFKGEYFRVANIVPKIHPNGSHGYIHSLILIQPLWKHKSGFMVACLRL